MGLVTRFVVLDYGRGRINRHNVAAVVNIKLCDISVATAFTGVCRRGQLERLSLLVFSACQNDGHLAAKGLSWKFFTSFNRSCYWHIIYIHVHMCMRTHTCTQSLMEMVYFAARTRHCPPSAVPSITVILLCNIEKE